MKQLIEKVVAEAMALPDLKEIAKPVSNGVLEEDEDITNKSYEDILATAILNKVQFIGVDSVLLGQKP